MNPRLNDREHAEQVAVIDWALWHESRWPELKLLYAIPNGGHRHKRTAARLRAEGVKSGVPDLFLPVARQGHHGLYIEMKAPGGRERDSQKWWRERLTAQGYKSVVCTGAEQAIEQLTYYLGSPTAANSACASSDPRRNPLAASGF